MEQIPGSQTAQLVQYIQQAHASGMSDEEIRQELLRADWPENDIERALFEGSSSNPSSATVQESFTVQDARKLVKTRGRLKLLIIFIFLAGASVAIYVMLAKPFDSIERVPELSAEVPLQTDQPQETTDEGFVLTPMSTPTPIPVEDQSRQANLRKRSNDLRQIQAGLQYYLINHSAYPADLVDLRQYVTNIETVLNDPLTGQLYTYERLENGTNYKLCSPDNCVTKREYEEFLRTLQGN